MSVIGIDLGNELSVIAQAKRGGIDIILNGNSKRLNASLVSFAGKERHLGDAATTQTRSNYKNTVAQVKRLIGRKFSDPQVQDDIANHLFYKVVARDDDEIGIEISYNDSTVVLTPEQVLAALLTKLKSIAEDANPGVTASDCVLSVPVSATDAERRAYKNAASIAGLNCLRLMNEPTAVALGYGIYKSARGEFSDVERTYACFVDMGHSTFTVSVVAYVAGKLQMLSAVADRTCGGRDIDFALAKLFHDTFKERTGIDCWANPKSRIKLLTAAEKSKKTLSPVGVNECAVNVEYVAEEKDLAMRLTIEQFDEACAGVLAKFEPVIKRALEESGIDRKSLSTIEIVGGGLRPRCTKKKIAELLDQDTSSPTMGLSTTLNMDEAVARGCALQCAILSPLFRVKDFEVIDCVPYSIKLVWEGGAGSGTAVEDFSEDTPEARDDSSNSIVIFKRGDATPFSRRVTFRRADTFNLEAVYEECDSMPLPPNVPRKVGKYTISGLDASASTETGADGAPVAPKVRVFFDHDMDGCFHITGAQLLKEVDAAPAPAGEGGDAAATPAADGADAAATPPAEGADKPADAPMEGGDDGAAKAADGKDAAAAGDDKAAAGADGKKEEGKPAEKKKKFRKVALNINTDGAGLAASKLSEFREEELRMAQQDRIIAETQAKRNEVETYVYDMRTKLDTTLTGFVESGPKDTLQSALNEAEDWLYGDGFDVSKSVYQARLDALKSMGDPIERRSWEAEHRSEAVSALYEVVSSYRGVATSTEDRYEHLDEEDRGKIKASCEGAEAWLNEQLRAQDNLMPHADPVVTVAQIRAKCTEVHNTCRPVASKPKPAPKPPTPPPEEKKEEAGDDKAKAEGEGEAAKGEGEAAPATDAAMDGDKPEGAAAGEAAPAADATAPTAEAGDDVPQDAPMD